MRLFSNSYLSDLTVTMIPYAIVLLGCVFPRISSEQPVTLDPEFNEAIGNFSLELLYHTTRSQTGDLVMSPFTVWSSLAAVTEGALRNTRIELVDALRITKKKKDVRAACESVLRELVLDSSTGQLVRVNSILVHKSNILELEYHDDTKAYGTFTNSVDFTKTRAASDGVNLAVSLATKGLINNLVHENDFRIPEMLIATAAYFKGQWAAAFDPSSTSKRPFYDSNGVQTGEVNMMFNRHAYPVVEMEALQASAVELPYGTEEKLSLLVILPNQNVSLTNVFLKFATLHPATVFTKLNLYKQDHGSDKIDCYIPRFKVESDLELTHVLQDGLGIVQLFDKTKANLGRMVRDTLYATKFIHKSSIEVTEDGNASATAEELTNTTDVPKFEANRPFIYFVVEKKTNTFLMAGVYQRPILY